MLRQKEEKFKVIFIYTISLKISLVSVRPCLKNQEPKGPFWSKTTVTYEGQAWKTRTEQGLGWWGWGRRVTVGSQEARDNLGQMGTPTRDWEQLRYNSPPTLPFVLPESPCMNLSFAQCDIGEILNTQKYL